MLLNHEDAEEAAQETFMKVYQALGRFNGQYQLGAWISRIATNVCLDHIRSRARKPQTTEASVELLELNTDLLDNNDPEEVVIRNSESRHVRRVLSKLPPMHRAAIVLRDFEGLPYEEIAKALEITDCQVKALIHRARQNFKKSWAREVASALIPAGFIDRLRKLTLFGREAGSGTSARVAEAAAPSMHTVASCASLAQQCGQAFAERVAPVAMAFLMGGTTVGAAAVASERSDEERPVRAVAADDDAVPSLGKVGAAKARAITEPSDDFPTPDGPPKEATEPVSEGPTTPPEEEPTDTGGQEPTPAPSATPAPGPAPAPITGTVPVPQPSEPADFSFAMTTGWAPEGGMCPTCGEPTAVVSESGRGDAEGLDSFSQSLTGTASNGSAPAFGAKITHSSSDMSHHYLTVGFRTAQGTYTFQGKGILTSSGTTDWGRLTYTFEGTYSLGTRPCNCENVPYSGRYRVEITFSPDQQRLAATRFSL